MTTFDLAKYNYERGTWTESMLQSLVNKKKLTLAEANQIIIEADEKN